MRVCYGTLSAANSPTYNICTALVYYEYWPPPPGRTAIVGAARPGRRSSLVYTLYVVELVVPQYFWEALGARCLLRSIRQRTRL